MMPEAPLQVGDAVEILPAAAPPPGQPTAPKAYGTIITVDQVLGRASVRLQGRRYPIDVPLCFLRRLTEAGVAWPCPPGASVGKPFGPCTTSTGGARGARCT